ncbi:BNR-4 repeat-containing protein [Chryseosolibacter indicus]|uniref:BNR-4 repeat-containing protein n=1 Tax=Chryseosolibacter indicus TaxID=2782351 RepID=A0ABS5VUV3_9BACT|nr:BNR-4 repeat-containing protein [Chryseosolibacter indicus]MBT1703771.1 BNR-4 repeat-containing protein [Chryseosolibacter indicus]
MQLIFLNLTFLFLIAFLNTFSQSEKEGSSNTTVNGYRGIWFTLNQFSTYGDKYSGGLGTYTAHHIPMAIYAPEVNKTFFVYGGTTDKQARHLLCMIGSFDHKTKMVSKPTIVHDKGGVDDPHDNPSIMLDGEGYVWVFVSGRNTTRKGYKYRSKQPYSIDAFEQITEEVFTYPQPWHVKGQGFFHFFTKYTGVRELYFETSTNGKTWSDDIKLAGIKASSDIKSGHYQVSNHYGNKIITFFNWHPNGNVDKRTNIYYLETSDFGKHWQTITGISINIPLQDVNSMALVSDYISQQKNVYLCDVTFDKHGNPICIYLTSKGHEPGPQNGPREWRCLYWTGKKWEDNLICTSDHNYDMGSLIVNGQTWTLIAPTENSPQVHGSGGEISMWQSKNKGHSWREIKRVTQQSDRNHNYVRRVVNGVPPFIYFWSDGDPGKQSISYLYFGDYEGHVWQLPYTMQQQEELPHQIR